MPNYAVDSSKQPMIATGVVGIVQEWAVMPDGKRRPTDEQARDEDTGMPLWQVEVLYQQTTYGRVASVTSMVAVGAPEMPKVPALSPVVFEGLRVEVRLTKEKALVEAWAADGLAGVPAAAAASGRGRAGGEAA